MAYDYCARDPGNYTDLDGRAKAYVGQAVNMDRRLHTHFRKGELENAGHVSWRSYRHCLNKVEQGRSLLTSDRRRRPD